MPQPILVRKPIIMVPTRSSLLLAAIPLTLTWFGVSVPRPTIGPSCRFALPAADTLRFVGISRFNEPPGALRLWADAGGHLAYSESWTFGPDHYLRDGSFPSVMSGREQYAARQLRNGVLLTMESDDRVGDSLTVVRDGKRTATAVSPNVLALPGLLSSAVRLFLVQCALQQPAHELETSRYGRVHAESVVSTQVRTGGRAKLLRLYLLRMRSGDVVARAWVDADGQVIAMPYADGELDLISPRWVGARDQLLAAEVRGSSPNCHSGFGLGSCEPGERVCNLPTSTTTPAQPVRSVIISDSGYSIRSDGRGAYFGDSANVTVPRIGVVAGVLLHPAARGEAQRSFVVDLNHPVRGDIGKPLGVHRVDGSVPGRFDPSGSDFINELAAHANTDWDQHQQSFAETPVGGSVPLGQLGLDFYINGVLHLLQMGPQPYGHCYAAGTAVYGDGTTMGTISHPDSSTWVVDLPPGSVARLFENRHGDPSAVNRGLYYVSLHFVIQK